jgi:predicted transcriptional regulator
VKRDSTTIIADILRVLANGRSCKKMSVVYKANLNFERVRKYLDLLIATGHVEIVKSTPGKDLYRITDKGRDFLIQYERLAASLRNVKQVSCVEASS